jgi:uncharacterized protein (PEP-CTERM system associated)
MRRVLIAGLIGLTTANTAFADPGISVSPSIGVAELYTDNVAGLQKSQPDLVTQVSPGVSINGESAYTKVNLTYQPTFNHFDIGNSPDRIDQSLNGTGTITPLRDELTIDFQTIANEAGASGNSSNQQGVLVPSNNLVLYYIGSLTPHLQEHLGDVATLDAYYGLNSSNTSVQGTKLPGLGITSTDTLGQSPELVIGSAESFGRLGLKLSFKHTDNSGSGMNTSSTSDVDTLGGLYHLNRVYGVSGSVGYQDINYPANGTTIAYESSGLTWTIGITITPNDQSSIALGYGFQQGAYNPSVQVGYALGQRTKVSASYLVTVQNQLTSTLQNLRFLTYDQFGNPIDSRTGLPFSAVNQTFGSQNVLFRDKPAILSVSHQFMRSSVTLTGQYEDRTSLTGLSSESKTLGVSINYSREFNPLLQGTLNVAYADNTSTGVGAFTGEAKTISLSASLFYRLSDTTTINIIGNYFNSMSNVPTNGSTTQQLTVGLRKSF